MHSRESLVDAIFGKLTLVYGRDFLGRWEGLDLAEVKADWARELARFLDHPDKILYALENLPDKAPNVLQFRSLCNAAPRKTMKSPVEVAGSSAPSDPNRVKAMLAEMRARVCAARWQRNNP